MKVAHGGEECSQLRPQDVVQPSIALHLFLTWQDFLQITQGYCTWITGSQIGFALRKPPLTLKPVFPVSDRGEALHEVHQPRVQPEEDALAETHGSVRGQDLHSDQVSGHLKTLKDFVIVFSVEKDIKLLFFDQFYLVKSLL